MLHVVVALMVRMLGRLLLLRQRRWAHAVMRVVVQRHLHLHVPLLLHHLKMLMLLLLLRVVLGHWHRSGLLLLDLLLVWVAVVWLQNRRVLGRDVVVEREVRAFAELEAEAWTYTACIDQSPHTHNTPPRAAPADAVFSRARATNGRTRRRWYTPINKQQP